MIRKMSIPVMLILMGIFTPTLRAQDAKAVPPTIIDQIVGTWKMQRILSGKKEVAKNPTSGHWIEFRSDGTYVNQSNSLDSGSYRTDENRSIVVLESSVVTQPSKNSPKEIGEWSVAFHDGTMTLQRQGDKQHSDKMKYIYIRIADGESVKRQL